MVLPTVADKNIVVFRFLLIFKNERKTKIVRDRRMIIDKFKKIRFNDSRARKFISQKLLMIKAGKET